MGEGPAARRGGGSGGGKTAEAEDAGGKSAADDEQEAQEREAAARRETEHREEEDERRRREEERRQREKDEATARDMSASMSRPSRAAIVLWTPETRPGCAALTGDPAVMSRAGISGLSRGAAALGVAIALGELEIEHLKDIHIGKDFNKYATRAMTFSGTEVKHCEVLVLGNRQGANGTSRIYSRQLNDILDTRSLKALFCEAGCNLDEIGELVGKEMLQAVLLKAGIAPDGRVRGERTTVYQSEVDPDKHMRASASGVVGSLLGTIDGSSTKVDNAVKEVKNLPNKPQQEDLLKLYGLYKRATLGVCNIEKPWAVQIEASMKWNAWNDVSLLTINQAMTTYIMLVNKLFRDNNIFKNI